MLLDVDRLYHLMPVMQALHPLSFHSQPRSTGILDRKRRCGSAQFPSSRQPPLGCSWGRRDGQFSHPRPCPRQVTSPTRSWVLDELGLVLARLPPDPDAPHATSDGFQVTMPGWGQVSGGDLTGGQTATKASKVREVAERNVRPPCHAQEKQAHPLDRRWARRRLGYRTAAEAAVQTTPDGAGRG